MTKIRELFLKEDIKLPPHIQDLIDRGVGKLLNGKLYIWGETGNVSLSEYELIDNTGQIMFPLADIEGDLDCFGLGLTTFKNFPHNVAGSLFIASNRFKSLDGITPTIGGMLDISGNENITNLSGVSNHIKSCEDILLPPTIISNILGLLKIQNLQSLGFDDSDEEPSDELLKAVRIVNYHIAHGKDILACQEELIEAGLKHFAKL